MLYVQQSLAPDEEILMAAEFHWMYTLTAAMWIVFGCALSLAISLGGVWWDVTSSIQQSYPGLPDRLFVEAWDQTVTARGGYMHVLWGISSALRIASLCMFVAGLFLFASMMITRATTEIAVTTDRVVYKKGMIARHVGELGIDRIEGISVYQGVIGRILGYGRVSIRGMGVGEVILPPIANPIEFRKAVQEARIMQERGGAKTVNKDEF